MTCSCGGHGVAAGITAGTPAAVAAARAAAAVEPLDAAFPVPAYPPADWFTERPSWLTPETKLQVDDQGRVAGYFYNAGQCLIHDAAACPRPSPTGYSAFHQQEVITASGEPVRVGVIGNVGGHADPYARVDAAQRHYADPNVQLISCRAYDDEHGGYILGALVPHATYSDVALARRSALSGDWRPMPESWWTAHGVRAAAVQECEGFDCIGPTLVTRPGLPLVRRYGRAASLGGAGGVQLPGGTVEPDTVDTAIPAGMQSYRFPDGTTVTTNVAGFGGSAQQDAAGPPVDVTPPGPHPVPAVQAAAEAAAQLAAPPAADAPPAGDATDSGDLEARVSRLEEVVSQLVDAVQQSMQASAIPLPPAE